MTSHIVQMWLGNIYLGKISNILIIKRIRIDKNMTQCQITEKWNYQIEKWIGRHENKCMILTFEVLNDIKLILM